MYLIYMHCNLFLSSELFDDASEDHTEGQDCCGYLQSYAECCEPSPGHCG